MPESLADPLRSIPMLIVDSWPIMEWLKAREPVATKFDELLASAKNYQVRLLLSGINFGEVYYLSWHVWGEARAEAIAEKIDNLPIHIFQPRAGDSLSAARVKARHKCSYADAFAVVLASEFVAAVVTGDKDFLRMQQAGAVDVEWWGA